MKRGVQQFSGQRQRYDFLAVAEIAAACDAFFRSRDMPVSLPPLGMERPATEAATAAESPIQQSAMENRRIIHESKPATGPRKWTRKVNSTPPPSLKINFREIVAAGIKSGLVKPPKRQP